MTAPTLKELGTKGAAYHTIMEPFVQALLMFVVGSTVGLVLLVKYAHVLWGMGNEGGMGQTAGFTIVSVIVGGFLYAVRRRSQGGTLPADLKANTDLRGKNIIVTGANSGIGKTTATQLVEWGAHVIMACRNETLARSAIDDIKKKQGSSQGQHAKTGSMEYVHLDLAQFDSVRKFSKAVENKPIHQLVCNAGVLSGDEFRTSGTGHEAMVGVNHLGHFLLVKCLMENLTTNNARVIVVSSAAHVWMAPSTPLDVSTLTPEYSKAYYDANKYYGLSKLCNLLFATELQNKFGEAGSKATAYSLHPGCIPTNLPATRLEEGNKNPGALKRAIVMALMAIYQAVKGLVFKNSDSGAATTLYLCARSSDYLSPGAYFQDCAPFPGGPGTDDVAARKALWDYSEQVCSQN